MFVFDILSAVTAIDFGSPIGSPIFELLCLCFKDHMHLNMMIKTELVC